MQKCISLALARQAGVPRWQQDAESRLLNSNQPQECSPRVQDRFAAMLKRQAREIMRSVTECPAASISAHIARLCDLTDVIRFVIASELVDEAERVISDRNLLHPSSLADYQAALALTRTQHRAPVFVSAAAAELAQINAKLDTLAGWLARGQA